MVIVDVSYLDFMESAVEFDEKIKNVWTKMR